MSFDISMQYDRLYRYCYYHTHNRILAQDIVQEAFTRYMERYGSLNEKNAVPYLYVIARNLCIDHYRRQGTQADLRARARANHRSDRVERQHPHHQTKRPASPVEIIRRRAGIVTSDQRKRSFCQRGRHDSRNLEICRLPKVAPRAETFPDRTWKGGNRR